MLRYSFSSSTSAEARSISTHRGVKRAAHGPLGALSVTDVEVNADSLRRPDERSFKRTRVSGAGSSTGSSGNTTKRGSNDKKRVVQHDKKRPSTSKLTRKSRDAPGSSENRAPESSKGDVYQFNYAVDHARVMEAVDRALAALRISRTEAGSNSAVAVPARTSITSNSSVDVHRNSMIVQTRKSSDNPRTSTLKPPISSGAQRTATSSSSMEQRRTSSTIPAIPESRKRRLTSLPTPDASMELKTSQIVTRRDSQGIRAVKKVSSRIDGVRSEDTSRTSLQSSTQQASTTNTVTAPFQFVKDNELFAKRKIGSHKSSWEDVLDKTYGRDIFEYFKSIEMKHVLADWTTSKFQTDVTSTHRFTLVDWMLQVHNSEHLSTITLFHAVNLMDRFMCLRRVSLSKYQLVGAVALWIASKKHDRNALSLKRLSQYCANIYSFDEFKKAERFLLDGFKWDLAYTDLEFFVERLSKVDVKGAIVKNLARYLIEVALLDPAVIPFPTRAVAAAAVFISMKILAALPDSYAGIWTKAHADACGFDEQKVNYVAKMLVTTICRKEGLGFVAKKWGTYKPELKTCEEYSPSELVRLYFVQVGRIKA